MEETRIALGLYSVRDECDKDLVGTLETVAKMGYKGVEFPWLYSQTVKEIQKLKRKLEDLELKVAGVHVELDSMLGDQLEKTIELNKAFGNHFLIIPWLPEEKRKTEWLRIAHLMNEISAKIKNEGMQVGYHNHSFEFIPIDGETPWDILFSSTNPEVIMQLDTGNAMHGGAEPDDVLEVIKHYPGRARTVHLKEYSATNSKALIGEGDMKWLEFLKLCETIGDTEWYIIEQETYAYSPLECVKRCIVNLKEILKNRKTR
jgi:sugar phosphate isomerase/epimerase